MTTDTLDREEWRRLLTTLDLPTPAGVIDAVADARDCSRDRAEDLLEDALATGPLREDPDVGAFGRIRLDDADAGETTGRNPDCGDETPTPGVGKPPSPRPDTDTSEINDGWDAADFATTNADTYPPTLLDREQWMGHVEKKPFAPWGDADPDDADPEDSPRWEWGRPENYVDGPTVAIAEDDPRLDGRVFLQQDADPFAFVDGDDVKDPDTDEIHPAFLAILEHLGVTYADVSTSGAGVHAQYRAPEGLPIDGKGQATFPIDTEPWGANDDVPTVEIYANKHVCVATGEHVDGTPREVRAWDADALRAILEANGYDDEDPISHDTDRDRAELDGYDPGATDREETTEDVRDIYAAVDRLRPSDLPLSTRSTGEDSTGWTTWNPSYRRSESGASVHSPPREPVFHDHKEGEAFGVLSLFAAEQGIISNPWDRLAGGDWFDAVDAAREAGAPIPEYDPPTEYDPDAEPVAPLALAKLDVLTGQDRERLARKIAGGIPTTDEGRRDLRDAVVRELRAGNTTVLDAPTALGKTYTVATEPWRRRAGVTGESPVVHAHATREARDEAAAETDASGVCGAVLKGRTEASPLARGDHDPPEDADEDAPDTVVTIDGQPASEWFDRMCDEKGIPFSTALALAREHNDQDLDELPPIGEEDPAVAQWDGLPRDDDGHPAVDVIHATHQFLYVPSLRRHTNVIIDEQPDFTKDLGQDRIRRMVNAYLRALDAPVSTWEQFVTLAKHDAHDTDAARERDAVEDRLGRDPPTEWFVEDPDAHALAPDLTKALWNALRWEDPDANGRRNAKVFHEPPRLDAGEGDQYAGVWLSVVIDDENTVRTVRATPDLSQARAVIGLDAHPSMPMWELNAGPGMTRDAVLDPTERRLWRRYERELTTVQVGDAARPRSGEKAREWMTDERVRAVLDRLRDHYGEGLDTAITTTQVEGAVREHLEDVAGEDLDEEHTMHYGEEKSRNPEAFAAAAAGYVYGCMDPGDDMILDAIAELDLDATPATATTDDGEEYREKGRTFAGTDADTAREVLASVRENHVAQAAGRYARAPDDPESGAVVYVHTDAAPPGFVDVETPGVEWLATELQREIIDALADRPSATLREIADAVDCSKEHVRETLGRLDGEDLVARVREAGEHGADVYRAGDVEGALVDLGETANAPLRDHSRWSLVVRDRHTREDGPPPDVATDHPGVATADGSDRPPDPGD
jgi:hypothetical protein